MRGQRVQGTGRNRTGDHEQEGSGGTNMGVRQLGRIGPERVLRCGLGDVHRVLAHAVLP